MEGYGEEKNKMINRLLLYGQKSIKKKKITTVRRNILYVCRMIEKADNCVRSLDRIAVFKRLQKWRRWPQNSCRRDFCNW